MNRREVIGLAASATAAASLPSAVGAQTSSPKIVGFVSVRSAADSRDDATAFVSGLAEQGFGERNVSIEYRWGEGSYDRLKAGAEELVQLRASVIAGFGSAPALLLKQLTTTIPVVFTSSADPVTLGLVDSLSKPGGNVTGVSFQAVELNAKRIEILSELAPKANVIGTLVNPDYPNSESELADLKATVARIGRKLRTASIRAERDLEAAFASLKSSNANVLIINGDAFFNRIRGKIIAYASAQSMPAIYPWPEYALDGGLISYGPSLRDGYRQAGTYAGKILKGTRPSDLPVLQPVKFELVLNAKTAKKLRLDIPPALLARASDVIE